MHRLPLIVAGLIFTFVGFMHVWRILGNILVIINEKVIPMSWSVLGMIVAFSLAAWMFWSALSNGNARE